MKNNEWVKLDGSGLKCDNPKCDWNDPTIPDDTYKDWVNKPCPKCGENLLTEEDFTNAEAMRKAIAIVNSMSEEELDKFNKNIADAGIAIKDLPFFKDAIGLENLNTSESVIVKVDMHKGVKATIIKDNGKSANN